MAGGSVKDLHVAIVGAGIAGLALAMSLHRKRVSFTLYEEAQQYSAVGAGIGFGPNGVQAMNMIEEAFLPMYDRVCVGNKGDAAQHVFFEGLLMEEGLGLKENWYGSSSWGHPNYTRKSAHRKALLDIMTSFIPSESVQFDKRVVDIKQKADKVLLTFADGGVAEASIVAGADGIQSVVRQHVLRESHPEQIEPVYANSYCYRGVIPIEEAKEILGELTDVAKFYFGDKRSCVTYRISGGAEFNFLLCVADTSNSWKLKNAVTEKVTHEAMMADFSNRGVDNRMLQLLNKASPIKWGFFHHPHTSTYYLDRVVLMGDGAHGSLPFQAAGAAQGLEDAVILANQLAEVYSLTDPDAESGPYIRAALDGYDLVRRPRAQKQLEQSAEVERMIHFQHSEAGGDMSKILPRLQESRFDWLWFHDLNDDLREASRRMKDLVDV